ncbi:MAG TPA: succinate dehydrogenase, hydrophobic membrane anchor protein, partial [Gammaproteobacteria bacterium]|nr:succinate dehydrogenase, hydrophobic membrane anchor protein [Gammaproteobacteria bacterium]
RGLGTAKKGVQHWWWQRLTAVVLVPLCLWFIGTIVTMQASDYSTVVNWIQSPLVSGLWVFLIAALFYHAQLGLQVVIEDYVHSEWVKITVLVVTQFLMVLLALTAVVAVLKIALGAP